jgi:hypothetical protein
MPMQDAPCNTLIRLTNVPFFEYVLDEDDRPFAVIDPSMLSDHNLSRLSLGARLFLVTSFLAFVQSGVHPTEGDLSLAALAFRIHLGAEKTRYMAEELEAKGFAELRDAT